MTTQTQTFFIVASATPGAMSPTIWPTREMADMQASLHNFRWTNDLPYCVVEAELPVVKPVPADAASTAA